VLGKLDLLLLLCELLAFRTGPGINGGAGDDDDDDDDEVPLAFFRDEEDALDPLLLPF